ncbi:TPA: hypothetical protein DEQ22_00615 [Candidatus Nomurabacteria bacterium]|uniref:Uncharacterized protein n=1 Tax=Candidatus Nomurabacteria bacterium RIFOXYA2_FULL_42_12 TaxID=1801801 RepID=A0A1F6YM14_9BACT|nr:MAG: hypothetical protein A2357_01775 [Candidatus Nomurabacteria bacterium RIFOXYB1_FULL_43_14]OGJ07377.1 MAG: hypothetical protein A2225_00285 [Candidatus Nomurabacteria bacterium RIFOXYA2_FULL_42_12]OGJ08044.1 MAG: hypothetical protein A2183_01285 [Candidatus Nomurabacteria bacterium RIFOXYA1_FULL_42_12]OGJ09816.1 MAG: hypothetical protein A2443_01825 [Candidatus Nomurabacteria bacterium RIFOXYC2_FULL_43_16]OGJ14330.1 MAG: hypothetical protein A2587_01150 [Candidatus Nomurabacteria bacteri
MQIVKLQVATTGEPVTAKDLAGAIKRHSASTGTKIEVIFSMVAEGQLVPIRVRDGEILLATKSEKG